MATTTDSIWLQHVIDLASKMGLTCKEATVLPVALSVAASKLGWQEDRVIAECGDNAGFRDYLAGACRDIAKLPE